MITARLPVLRQFNTTLLRKTFNKHNKNAYNVITRLNISTKPVLYNTSSSSSPSPSPSVPSCNRKRKIFIGLASLAALGIGYRWYTGKCPRDSNFISVHEDLKPYTTHLYTKDTPFQNNYTLLGSGVRTLSISTYKVYGMGIYIADDDLPLVSKVLDTNYLSRTFIDDPDFKNLSHREKVKLALNDPIKSEIIVNSLLDAGVRFLIKMTPIIRSNLTFVREGGIVKFLKTSPEYNDPIKYPGDRDLIDSGINEVRKAFTHKGSLVVNDDLIMELKKDNVLQFYYYNVKNNKFFVMGQVNEPLIGKILFRSYLSANKPLCEDARHNFVNEITQLI